MDKDRIRKHFELIASDYDKWKTRNHYYYSYLKDFFAGQTESEHAVIEYGCGTGDILASVNGKHKVGLDIAGAMIKRAREKHPDIEFHEHDGESPYAEQGVFDVAILSDIIDHITDILALYESVNRCLRIGGRMCISTINPLWDPIFSVAEKLGMKMPEGEHNFVPNRYLCEFLRLRGFRLVERGQAMLIPRRIPLISDWINRVAAALPGIRRFCIMQTIVAEKVAEYPESLETELTCSVVIPCYNEEQNIPECVKRTPNMGAGTEIIIVDDGSKDGTADAARKMQAEDPRVKVISYTPNHGKGYAVKQGFDSATGDILMILDADMTVMPEELPHFFRAVAEGIGDFANGTRMVYPMEQQAMRFLNHLGNFLFGCVLSWLLSQQVSDTLCGTKALRRKDYAGIHMGDDSWGDFDLLFGTVENNLRIVEVPVHYMARMHGLSKMQPFKHCLVLVSVCWQWFLRIKLKIRR